MTPLLQVILLHEFRHLKSLLWGCKHFVFYSAAHHHFHCFAHPAAVSILDLLGSALVVQVGFPENDFSPILGQKLGFVNYIEVY